MKLVEAVMEYSPSLQKNSYEIIQNLFNLIKPLKNNFDGSTRSTKPSKLKSNYYQSQNKSN